MNCGLRVDALCPEVVFDCFCITIRTPAREDTCSALVAPERDAAEWQNVETYPMSCVTYSVVLRSSKKSLVCHGIGVKKRGRPRIVSNVAEGDERGGERY
jgi:hypothetical protein